MPTKEEFHTTINIRRPLGLPLERPREQSSETFNYDLWIMINNYSKELDLGEGTEKDPTNFVGKNRLYVNIIEKIDNPSIKNVFLTLWGYYFCTENIDDKNICTCDENKIKELFAIQKKNNKNVLENFILENKPKSISIKDYSNMLDISLIKYIEYFRKIYREIYYKE